jgi:hypothetical protein
MTDEDFSELGEALEYACESASKNGKIVTCPFKEFLGSGDRYPEAVEAITGIPRTVVGAFNQGFDGAKRFPGFSIKAYTLGRNLRQKWGHPL